MSLPTGIVTLLTDFGHSDTYVAQMKAVMLTVSPTLQLVDISHDVGFGDVPHGAWLLAEAAPWFPPGTVHLAVVDPGVGSHRRAIAVRAGGQLFVGPDNGLLVPALQAVGADSIEAWTLDHVTAPGVARSATFHGRDLFAPAAAALASGTRRIEDLGTPIELTVPGLEDQPSPPRGRVVHVDRFGTLVTSIPADVLPPGSALVVNGTLIEARVRTYSDAPLGTLVYLAGSSGRVEVSVVGASAAERLGADRGAVVEIREP